MNKIKIFKSSIATILAICMVVSLLPLSMISSSAALLPGLSDWAHWELYARGLSTAGTIVKYIGDSTGDEDVMQMTSFIDSTICGNDYTSEEILQTCEQILGITENMEKVIGNMSGDLKSEKINKSRDGYVEAWNEQVMQVMKSGDGKESFYGVYDAYLEYLKYASKPDLIPSDKTLSYFENAYISELENYYSQMNNDYYDTKSVLHKNEYYQHQMFMTDAIDEGVQSIIASMLYNMNPDKNTLGSNKNLGNRFVDKASQFAYYAYPNASQQGDFIAMSIESQVNVVTTMVMIYQDFMARRADYFNELSYVTNNFIANENVDRNSLNDKQKVMYDRFLQIKDSAYENPNQTPKYEQTVNDLKSTFSTQEKCTRAYNEFFDDSVSQSDFVGTIEKYKTNMTEFLKFDLYLTEVNAHANFNDYPRSSDDKNSVKLKNTCFKNETVCYHEKIWLQGKTYEKDHKSTTKISNESVFSKRYATTIQNNKIVIVPYYVFTGQNQDVSLSAMDYKVSDCGGFFNMCDCHFMQVDYLNMKSGEFSDGTNTYVPLSNANQLKELINETYFTANGCSVTSYFADMMGYAQGKQNYLLLNGDTQLNQPYWETGYTNIPVINMNNTSYPNINNETINYENYGNSVYSVILIPNNFS